MYAIRSYYEVKTLDVGESKKMTEAAEGGMKASDDEEDTLPKMKRRDM